MNWLTNNLGLKLFSLLAAIVLGYYVESQSLLTASAKLTVQMRQDGLSDEYTWTLIGKPVVDVRGDPEAIREATLRNTADINAGFLNVVLDLSRATPGKGTYRGYFNPRFPYSNLTYSRPEYQVLIEPKFSKTLPVTLPGEGIVPPSGLALDPDNTAFSPKEVTIWGRKVDIDKVAAVTPTSMDLRNYVAGRTKRYQLVARYANGDAIPDDASGNQPIQIEPPFADVYPALVETNPEKDVFVSANLVGEPSPGYEVRGVTVTPAQVKASGDSHAVSAVNVISTEPIRISGAKESFQRKVRLRLSDATVSVSSVKVSVRIVHVFNALGTAPKPKAAPIQPVLPNPGGGTTSGLRP